MKKDNDEKFIHLNKIPNDLDDILDEDDISFQGNNEFDKAMIENNFFEYGGFRRSHRIVTKKAKELGYFGIVETLTGLSEEEVRDIWKKQIEEKELKILIELAEKYNYSIKKN